MKLCDALEYSNTYISLLAIVACVHDSEFAVAITSALFTDKQPKISPHINCSYFNLNVNTYFKLKLYYLAAYWLMKLQLNFYDFPHRLHCYTEVAEKLIIYSIFRTHAQAAHNNSKQLVHVSEHQQIRPLYSLHQNNSTSLQHPIPLVQY